MIVPNSHCRGTAILGGKITKIFFTSAQKTKNHAFISYGENYLSISFPDEIKVYPWLEGNYIQAVCKIMFDRQGNQYYMVEGYRVKNSVMKPLKKAPKGCSPQEWEEANE